jgi:protoheme IX farnesyltransferase
MSMVEHPGTREPSPARALDVTDASRFVASLIELTKPSITRMVLVTTACGAAIAPGPIRDYGKLCFALLGTSLIVGAANALNMFLEGDTDALMKRTRERPIPSGRLSPEVALWFGGLLAFIGLPILDFYVNPLTAFVGGFALLSYVLVYTPLKRVSSLAVWIGAVPGAAPPLMGWTSMTGTLSGAGLSLFLLMFIWQIPHFHAIALFRTDEYTRAGLVVLPASRGVPHTKKTIVGLLVVQLLVSALPAVFGLGGVPYIVAASVLGAVYLGFGIAGLRADAGDKWARSLFFASLPYLLVLLGVLVACS